MSEERPERGGAFEFGGRLDPQYSPQRDGEPDPGEVVWAWVPFEEDPAQGKDRPLVIIGRDADDADLLVGLMLSSKPHDHDPDWYPLGAGAWDSEHRPSWVRLDRTLAVTEPAVRREGAAIPPDVFLALVEAAVARSGAGGAAPRTTGGRVTPPSPRPTWRDRLRAVLRRSR